MGLAVLFVFETRFGCTGGARRTGHRHNGAHSRDEVPSMTTTSTARAALPLADVVIVDRFWAPRRETVRTQTIPHQERQLRRHGKQFDALKMQWKPGDEEPHIFWESDVAKWIEAASYSLAAVPDPEVDEAIALLGHAQQEDGYLNVHFTLVRPGRRFTDLRDGHELYCAGHLIEASVAHFEATGKTSLLDIARRYADLIYREFGPGGRLDGGYDGHEEIELALVRLARATDDRRYIDLAARFVEARGTRPYFFELEEAQRGDGGYFESLFPSRRRQVRRFREYYQSHLPVREQAEAVGHSVRAMYLYSAMADLASLLGDSSLRAACERLWESTTQRKMYVTAGIGSDASIEGFAGDYDLPNDSNYSETCASIGLVMWARRMVLLTGEARYADVMEQALYNTVLSSASADGTHYFYGNPMQSDGGMTRSEWFGTACCPPNFARMLQSLEFYAYWSSGNEAAIDLFVEGSATFSLDSTRARLEITTSYPSSGEVMIAVHPERVADFTVSVRVPGWAVGATASVNTEPIDVGAATVDGYLKLAREWSDGDVIAISLPMAPTRVRANDVVTAAAGLVSLRRGPLVYCVEGLDVDAAAGQVVLPDSAQLSVASGEGVDVVLADGFVESSGVEGQLYGSGAPRRTPITIRAVPYFTWGNRGDSSMRVWLRSAAG
jgi:DUF1680 family protein